MPDRNHSLSNTTDSPPALFILDTFGIIFRSYFAFIRNPLRNSKGKNVSAIFGVLRAIIALFKEWNPRYLAMALDSTVPTFRHERYPDYKKNRDKTPDDLIEQIPAIKDIISSLGIPFVGKDRFEADDVIATYAAICARTNRRCYVVSGDKDLLQIVGENVAVLRPETGGLREMWAEDVRDKLSVRPDQVLDYLSLIGDSSDNVPGVAGIGPKSAVALLEQFDTLDAIYDNIDAVEKKAMKTKLERGRELAYLSRSLIALREDVEVGIAIEDLMLPERLNYQAAESLLIQQGMMSLRKDLMALRGDDGDSDRRAGDRNGDGRLDNASDAASFEHPENHTIRKQRYHRVDTIESLARLVNEASKVGSFAFDCETDNIDPMRADPIGFSISYSPDSAYYIPLRGPDGPILDQDETKAALAQLLSNSSYELIGQNIKYDYKVLYRWGITIKNRLFDTMVAAWLLDSNALGYNIDALALRHLNYETIHFADLFPPKKRGEKQPSFEAVPLDRATDYAAEDADIALRLANYFRPLLDTKELTHLLRDIEMPLIPILAAMEIQGVSLDQKRLNLSGVEFRREIELLRQEIYRLCGREFNIDSPKQLQEILFNNLGLSRKRKTKTGYSTDSKVLTELAYTHPVPERILRYRLLTKLQSTYIDALQKMVNPMTNRIHTNYNLTGTATGRISSQDPNLQNIPIRNDEGRQIRAAFVPAPGHVFVSADYSQIELVVLAHLSGDSGLCAAFAEHRDVHRQTGSLIFGVEPDMVDDRQRRIAKAINFGVVYGMSAFRLSRDLAMPIAEAQQFLETYFATYPMIKSFISDTLQAAKKDGEARTILSRRRSLPNINNRNRNIQAASERIAINTPIQGSAADIMKLAMLRIDKRLRTMKLQSAMILQVHDEIILECPIKETEITKKVLREEMSVAAQLKIPLMVDLKSGANWGEL